MSNYEKVNMVVEVERRTCEGCGAIEAATDPERVERMSDGSLVGRGGRFASIHEVQGLVKWNEDIPHGTRFRYGPMLCLTCRIVAWDAMRKVIPALHNLPARGVE